MKFIDFRREFHRYSQNKLWEIFEEYFKKDRAELLLDFSIDHDQEDDLRKIIKSSEKEPLAYIFNRKTFFKRDFYVDRNVLIPREETEGLVQRALKLNPKKILDMCTGSGAIAITLSLELNREVDAVDISRGAIEVATKNRDKLGAKVNFIESDLFTNVEKKYDLIISNPPYIKEEDYMELQEIHCEPKIALLAEEDGIYFYRKIISQADKYLEKYGYLLFEIGYDQREKLIELANRYNYQVIYVEKDLSSYDRYVLLKRLLWVKI